MTILEEEKHSASASSAVSKDSISITTVSPSTSSASSATPGVQGASTVARMTSAAEVNGTAKNHLLSTMISNVADRYITPEYLAPLPSSVSILFWSSPAKECFFA